VGIKVSKAIELGKIGKGTFMYHSTLNGMSSKIRQLTRDVDWVSTAVLIDY